MSLEDYSLMREVIAAIREGLPEPTIAARCSISACAGGAARLFEERLKNEQFYLLRPNS